MEPDYRPITISPSHYREKARWALDYPRVPYREEGHPPLLHLWAVKAAGGGHTTPVLLPRDYGSPLPSLEQVPAEMLAQVEEFRTTPAGVFAMRIYRDHQ